MSATPDGPQPNTPSDQPGSPDHAGMAARAGDAAKLWARRVVGAIAVLAVLVIIYFSLAAIVPRWWAERLGRVIDGSMTTGVGLGLAIGIVCTAIPILLLVFAARHVRSRAGLAIGAAVLAIIAALPNLLTLTIVLGSGNAAHAGERILDVAGPMFRGASAVGAVVGALLAIALVIWNLGRGRRKARKQAEKAAAKQVKIQAKEAAKAEKAAARAERRAPSADGDGR